MVSRKCSRDRPPSPPCCWVWRALIFSPFISQHTVPQKTNSITRSVSPPLDFAGNAGCLEGSYISSWDGAVERGGLIYSEDNLR